jgi:Carboxypeptidase regulatory-like domain
MTNSWATPLAAKIAGSRIKMRLLSLAAFCVLFALIGLAQGKGGAITGSVTDEGGAAVSGLPIQALDLKTGATYKTTTSAAGAYTFEQLPAASYEVSIPVLALRSRPQTVIVQETQRARLDIHVVDASLNTLGEDRAYFTGHDSPHVTPKGPTPRTPEGKPDFSGVWWAPRVTDGGAPSVLPWAAALIKERAANNAKEIPRARCLPDATTLLARFGVNRLVQTSALLVVIEEEDVPGYRQIFLDGRAHPKDMDPTWTGHSIGVWEGDTLVVDTVGFNDKSWLADLPSMVTPHTEMLHLTTRLRRPDLGHLESEVTFDDPGTFAKPWTMKAISDLAQGEDVEEWICNENNQDLGHLVGP